MAPPAEPSVSLRKVGPVPPSPSLAPEEEAGDEGPAECEDLNDLDSSLLPPDCGGRTGLACRGGAAVADDAEAVASLPPPPTADTGAGCLIFILREEEAEAGAEPVEPVEEAGEAGSECEVAGGADGRGCGGFSGTASVCAGGADDVG